MNQHKRSLFTRAYVIWKALFDKRTPFLAKALVILGILYGVSPIDIIPDLLPLIGITDDAGVLLAVFLAFMKLSASVRKSLYADQ